MHKPRAVHLASLAAAALLLLAVAHAHAQTLTRGPLLQNPDGLTTTMTLVWWTDVAGNSTVEYGTTTGLGSSKTVAQAGSCEIGAAGTCHGGRAAHLDAPAPLSTSSQPSIRVPDMPPTLRKGLLQHRPWSLAAALALAAVLLLAPGTANAESLHEGQAPTPFGPTEGVPDEWIVALNDYVADPAKGGSRLIALTRQSDIELPPMVQVVVADAYLRAGNRRAAQRAFEEVLARNPGYPWDDFGNLGMGTVRLMAGDTRGAEEYFGRLENAGEASSRVLGNLGKGSALAAAGRFDEARAAFDKASSWETVDTEFRQAGRFGSASAQFAAGDYEGALKAFEELAASDPDGPIGRDARFAAARARLALGEFDEGAAGLRKITEDCDDERQTRRPSRALCDLDARAIGRTWVRNYRTTPWTGLFGKGNNMMSIDGCALARATLPAAEREDRRLMGVQRISTGAAARPETGRAAVPEVRGEPAVPGATSGSSWLPFVVAAIAAAAVLALLWRRSSSRA